MRSGRLGDLFGHRRLFLIGLSLFTLGALFALLASLLGAVLLRPPSLAASAAETASSSETFDRSANRDGLTA